MRRSIRRLWIIGLMVLLAPVASAFNGKRKGFVLGGGLGTFNLPPPRDDSKVWIHFSTGVGLSEKDIIEFEGAGAGSEEVTDWGGDHTYSVFAKSFAFVSWYHYLHASKSTWFAGVGFGKYNSTWMGGSIFERPYSLMTSAGYEYHHLRAKLYLFLIHDDASGREYRGLHVGMTVGALAF